MPVMKMFIVPYWFNTGVIDYESMILYIKWWKCYWTQWWCLTTTTTTTTRAQLQLAGLTLLGLYTAGVTWSAGCMLRTLILDYCTGTLKVCSFLSNLKKENSIVDHPPNCCPLPCTCLGQTPSGDTVVPTCALHCCKSCPWLHTHRKGKCLMTKIPVFFQQNLSTLSELKEVVETEFAAVKENNRRKCWTSVDNETGRHECISGLTLHFMNKLIHSYRVGVGATRMHSTMMNISKTKKNHYYCHRSYRILVKLSLGS